jgi:hypothetical protein
MHFPQSLASLLDAAKGDQGLASCLLGRHAARNILLDLFFHMETELVTCVIVSASIR